MTAPFLRLAHVSKRFHSGPGPLMRRLEKLLGRDASQTVHAVSDLSLSVARGEVVGLVGESGCGKSTTGRMAAGIYTPSAGQVLLDGQPVACGPDGAVRKLTTRVQIIHQDPFASLNPRMTVGDTVAEGPLAHRLIAQSASRDTVAALLQQVGLDAASADRLPHQFSGGQRQRIAIARALAMQPDVLVLDEPVASLDVSIQAQILNLFMNLRAELSLTAIFISHDLSVIRHVCDRIAIMYLGRIVELASRDDLYAQPLHPYTAALLASIPKLGQCSRRFYPIQGETPSPLNPPTGCTFHPRCPQAGPRCRAEVPVLKSVDGTAPPRTVACHLHDGETLHADVG